MEFYYSTDFTTINASPFSIEAGDTKLFYTSMSSAPFIIKNDGTVFFGIRGSEHDGLEAKYGDKDISIRGRIWLDEKAISTWEDFPNKEDLKPLANALVKRVGISPKDIRLFLDCGFKRRADDKSAFLVAELPLSEYLTLNTGVNPHDFFWTLFEKQQKLQVANKANTTINGMSDKDVWRHYEIGESKIRFGEKELRALVKECVSRIL